MRRVHVLLFAAGLAVTLSAPGVALAQTTTQPGSSVATLYAVPGAVSAAATSTYDLNFTLPTAAKSGCMVCHGDRNLVRVQNGITVSMYISPAMLATSAHATTQCTGCHLDFAYSVPHPSSSNEAWRAVAKAACKNCHQEAYTANSSGVHSPAPSTGITVPAATTSGVTVLPLCGDCHGSHDIQKLKGNPAGQKALHASGKQVCGTCHQDYWDNYNDYYHGAAYKNGAPDAPVCWQCHKAHDILPSSDRRSSVNQANLVETCGQCHLNEPNETYTSYSQLIHHRDEMVAANPLVAFWRQMVDTVRSWFN